MENKELIPIERFCAHYQIEFAFIRSLSEYGLVEIITIEGFRYLKSEQLAELEKMVRLHFDLDINLEGIDAITHLLQRMAKMQEEMKSLKNRLGLYEN
jgi:hypothetical protein